MEEGISTPTSNDARHHLERLQNAISEYQFEDNQQPHNSTYGSFHFLGRAKDNTETRSPERPQCLLGNSLHPCLDIDGLPVDEDAVRFSGDTDSAVIAIVTTHVVRLEREYKLASMLYNAQTPASHHFVRPLKYVKISLEQSGEALAVLLIAAPSVDYIQQMKSLTPTASRRSKSDKAEKDMAVHNFLDYAIGACECLETLHYRHGLIHGDIRPDTFHFDTSAKRTRMVNPGCGVRNISQAPGGTGFDKVAASQSKHLYGYYAPEQTGRYGAVSDTRTDIYSLGVSFWSIMCQQHAFTGQNPSEIIQTILFKKLPLLSSQRPEIPTALSAIVHKMIKRQMDERYNSILTVKKDLKEIRQMLLDGDTLRLSDFRPTEHDSSCLFRLPQSLIGRRAELALIKDTMESVLGQLAQTLSTTQGQLGVLNSPSLSAASDAGSDTASIYSNDSGHSGQSFDSIDTTCLTAPSQGTVTLLNNKDGFDNQASYAERTMAEMSIAEVLKRTTTGQKTLSQELGNKLQVAQQLSKGGRVEVLSITGPSGRGKTMLVRHLRQISRGFCYFAYAKFDRTKDRPFEALFQLLSSLLLQIFSESDTETLFHNTLQEYIAPHWDELQPHLSLAEMSADTLLGSYKPPHATTDGEIDSKRSKSDSTKEEAGPDNHSASQSLLKAGSSNKSPRFVHVLLEIFRLMAVQKLVCLCLDDLRYADAESLEFINALVDTSVPLVVILTAVEKSSSGKFANKMLQRSSNIDLAPLNSEEIEAYVSQVLHRSIEYCVPLASLIEEHTKGNPALMGDMMDKCYASRNLYYCWKCEQWEYKLRPLMKHFASPDARQFDINALLQRHFSGLPELTQAVLRWAAVVGYTFSYRLLNEVVSSQPDLQSELPFLPDRVEDPMAALQAAISRQIIRSTEDPDTYRFNDDNYYQAAEGHFTADQKAQMSYVVARTMLKSTNIRDQAFFAIDLFDHSRLIIACKDIAMERDEHVSDFCRILTQAAEISRDSGALSKAATFFKHAVSFLIEKPKSSARSGFMLLVKAAESFALISDHNEALEMLKTADRYAENRSDKALIAIIRSRAYGASSDHDAAFRTLRDELDLAPLQLSSPSLTDCDNNFWDITQRCLSLKQRSPSITARDDHKALASLLVEMLSTLFWRDEARSYQAALVLVQLHNDYGILSGASLGLIFLAAVAMYRFGDARHAIELRDHATSLLKQSNQETYLNCRISIMRALLIDHLEPGIQSISRSLSSSTEASASAGDQSLHLLNLAALASVRMEHSDDLQQIQVYIERSIVELPDWSEDTNGGAVLKAIYQCVRALQGKTKLQSAATILDDDEHNTERYLEDLQKKDPGCELAKCAYDSCQMVALFIYGYSQEALDLGMENLEILQGYRRLPSSYRAFCFMSLAIAQKLRRNKDCDDREEFLEVFDALKSEIQHAASFKSAVYRIWMQLLEAEDPVDRPGVNDQTRAGAYDKAVYLASQYHLPLEEGLCLELYANFLLRKKCSYTAYQLLNQCTSAFSQISAFGKVEQLKNRHRTAVKSKNEGGIVRPFASRSSSSYNEQTRNSDHPFGPPQNTLPSLSDDDVSSIHSAMPSDGRSKSSGQSSVGLDIVDLHSVLQSSQALSSELDIQKLYGRLTKVLLEITGAGSCVIIAESEEDQDWTLASTASIEGVAKPPIGIALKDHTDWLLKQTVSHVLRFQEELLVSNFTEDERFTGAPKDCLDSYPEGQSVLCLPIIYGDRTLLGTIYCQARSHSMSNRTLTLSKLIVVQTAISIFNALLFRKMEKMTATCNSMIQMQKEALAQARQSEKKAREAEAKSMFLANVSHELRTPLNGVIGMSEILKTTSLDARQMECANSISLCADSLLGIINDILDFSKLEAGKMQAVEAPITLFSALDDITNAIAVTNQNEDIKMEKYIDIDRSLTVVSDLVRLQQVLMNLLSNAFKFTKKGSVSVRARVQREEAEKLEVSFAVEDTGIGIPAEQVNKLFTPFSQADASTARQYGGTGLGLSICKAIIEKLLGGRIWLRSIPDVGTTVAFSIPFRRAEPNSAVREDAVGNCVDETDKSIMNDRASQDKKRQIDVPREQVKVCIAEDNPINRRIATSYVSKLKLQYEAYEDGKQAVDAIEAASNDGNPFHIVLMDVQMPVLDGCGATKQLREHSDPVVRDVVVIAMTASAIAGDREKCLDAGMDNYLAKPVRLAAIKETLDLYVKE